MGMNGIESATMQPFPKRVHKSAIIVQCQGLAHTMCA